MGRLAWAAVAASLLSTMGCGDDDRGGGGDSGSGGMDAAGMDAAGIDAAGVDSGGGTDCGGTMCTAGQVCCVTATGRRCFPGPSCPGPVPDAGPPGDAGPMCGAGMMGTCSATGLSCRCCPAGGPSQTCLCSTPCTSSAECTDPARPFCNAPSPGAMGFCTETDGVCCWGCL